MARAVADDPRLGGVVTPVAPERPVVTTFAGTPGPPAPADGAAEDGAGAARFDPRAAPVPPPDRWELPDEDDPQVYLDSGEQDVATMGAALTRAGAPLDPDGHVLDFGCGYGRMLRWLPPGPAGTAWGVDVDAERVAWARSHLSPPLRFTTTSALPHLPFPDGRFDLVYAGSTFPHLGELADSWVLELGRVTRPGGHLYLTVYDERTVELILDGDQSPGLAAALRRLDRETGVLTSDWDVIQLSRRPGGAQVFVHRRWLERTWGRWFELLEVEAAALHVQSAVLLRAPG